MLTKIKKYFSLHRRRLITLGIILTLGISYLILIQFTSFRIPCIFQKITGFACPGCGITTMINHIFHLRFREAISENHATALILPLLAVVFLIRRIFKPKCLQNDGRLFEIIIYACTAYLLIFGVLRNLNGFEYLLPSYMR